MLFPLFCGTSHIWWTKFQKSPVLKRRYIETIKTRCVLEVAGEIELSCVWDSKMKCFSFCSDPRSSWCKIFTYNLEHKSGAFGSWKFGLAGTGSFCPLEGPCFLHLKAEGVGMLWQVCRLTVQFNTCTCFHVIHYLYKNSKAFTSFFITSGS